MRTFEFDVERARELKEKHGLSDLAIAQRLGSNVSSVGRALKPAVRKRHAAANRKARERRQREAIAVLTKIKGVVEKALAQVDKAIADIEADRKDERA